MVMLFKLVSCSNKHSCNCTTISEQTSWPEHVVLSQPVQREIGADSKGKAYLAASSNQPCRIIIHIQCTLLFFYIAFGVHRKHVCFFHWHLTFSQESNGDYSLQTCKEYLCDIQYIRLALIWANDAKSKIMYELHFKLVNFHWWCIREKYS